jgi:two-component system response regulator HydG
MKPFVLVVDDDPGIRYTLREILEEAEMDVVEAADGSEALSWLAENKSDLVITDLAMPGLDGMALLKKLNQNPSAPKIIMITAHGSERHAVEAMKNGAYDYFSKPFDIDSVMQVIERAVSLVRQEQKNEQLRAELDLAGHMTFRSTAMKRIASLVRRIGPRDVTVLITGPSGTGKERIADAIVASSPRYPKPFVRFNCAAVPQELAEAELFGHAKGAFTGAHKARHGLFREADSGSLLLDEVGELDLGTQGKLLRVLQEGRVRPVGEDNEIKVDVRLLAATNRNLEADIAEGRFREDLYYRLNVIRVQVPALNERMDDIPPLIDHFLVKYAERFGTGPIRLSTRLRQHLCHLEYPGNVRELENRIERIVALSSGGEVIDEEILTFEEAQSQRPGALSLREKVDAFEKNLIAAQLRRCRGNRSESARQLMISRVTLLDKIKKYELN